MMLTTKGRYAVMAMVDIAQRNEAGKPVSLADISTRQDITVPYLEQIFSRLKAGGLVKSVRGPGGGYCLSKAHSAITMADIVMAVDEPIKMTRCTTTETPGGCTKGVKCLTHDLWRGLGDSIHDYLASVTLDDVCKGQIAVNEDNHKACA